MQSRAFLPMLAIAALAASSAGATETVWAQAKLAAPVSAAKSESLGGVDWKCEGDTCVGAVKGRPASWSAIYACRKVANTFGPLASYTSRGQSLSAGNLAACNKGAAAAATQTAAQ